MRTAAQSVRRRRRMLSVRSPQKIRECAHRCRRVALGGVIQVPAWERGRPFLQQGHQPARFMGSACVCDQNATPTPCNAAASAMSRCETIRGPFTATSNHAPSLQNSHAYRPRLPDWRQLMQRWRWRSTGVWGRPCRARYSGEATAIWRRSPPSLTATMSLRNSSPSRTPASKPAATISTTESSMAGAALLAAAAAAHAVLPSREGRTPETAGRAPGAGGKG